jgi:hypothetical protein
MLRSTFWGYMSLLEREKAKEENEQSRATPARCFDGSGVLLLRRVRLWGHREILPGFCPMCRNSSWIADDRRKRRLAFAGSEWGRSGAGTTI